MAQIEKYYCRGCGAVLPVKANAGRIKCEYCGTVHLPNTEQKKDSGNPACPNCGFANPPQSQYCGDCGKSLFHTCPKCGTQNRMESVFCAKCGADIEKIISEEGPYKHVNIDDLYMEYLLEGKKLLGEYDRSFSAHFTLGLLATIAGIVLWANTISDTDMGFNFGNFDHYGPALGVLGIAYMIIGLSICSIRLKAKVARIAKTKPGFDKFYKIFRNNTIFGFHWPKTLSDERTRKEFLYLIGKK